MGFVKIIPYTSTPFKKATQKALTPVLGKIAAKKMATKLVGRFLGQLVPFFGWGLTAKDAWDNRENIKDFVGDMKTQNEANKDNLLWHVH